jgi:hypothetical protein
MSVPLDLKELIVLAVGLLAVLGLMLLLLRSAFRPLTNSPRRCATTIRCHRESAPVWMANQTSSRWRRGSTRCSSGSNLSAAGVRTVR